MSLALVGGRRPRGSPTVEPIEDATEIAADGAWSWFSRPLAIERNGALYVGYITGDGSVSVSKRTLSGTTTSFVLAAALEIDDHNPAALCFLPDGRLLAAYGKHDGDSVVRYRVSTSAEDISAWDAEQTFSSSAVTTYANPRYLSVPNRVYLHYRSGGGGGTAPMKMRHSADLSTWATEQTIIQRTSRRPYVVSRGNGVNRIDLVYTDSHPNEDSACNIYHCYMLAASDGSQTWHQSDGTAIGAPPFAPSAGTLIYDGSSVKGWVWDIQLDSSGNPHVLFATFPSSTDHRLNYARWTGSAWTTATQIVAMGQYLYGSEIYYSGGGAFHPRTVSKVFASRQIGATAAWQITEYGTTDSGATWASRGDKVTSPTNRNARPMTVLDSTGYADVMWWQGTYTSYVNYSTRILAAAGA